MKQKNKSSCLLIKPISNRTENPPSSLGKLIKLWVFFCVGFSLASMSSASAVAKTTHLSILGGVNSTFNTGGGIGYSLGLALDFWIGPVLDFSLGGQYFSRTYTGGGNANYVQIPAILRFRVLHIVQIGGGGFYDIPVTSGAGQNYGVLGSLRLKPMNFPMFIEGRYNYGLNTATFTSRTSEVQALLGIMF